MWIPSSSSGAQDVGDSDHQKGRKEDGDDQQDGDETHESRHAPGEFDDMLGQFGLIGGVFLDRFLYGGKFIFELPDGALLLGGVEGEGSLIGLKPGNSLFEGLEVHFLDGTIAEQIGCCADYVAFEKGEHLADERKKRPSYANGALQFAWFWRHLTRERGGGRLRGRNWPGCGGRFWQ